VTFRPLKRLRFSSLAAAVLAVACTSATVSAQDEGWNDGRSLELMQRARALRQLTVVDTTFRSYKADARGFVYFFIDRPDSEERTLVKADQIALEVFWQAPNLTSQRIVGLRDEEVLPTNIRYHLDHLTVVQDDFGDYIRLGDGDEVEQVLHPLGPASERVYDVQLADSLTLMYGGEGDEVRVYEVRVRPKDFDAPGFVGSVYLDRANAAVVRMSFTFTPSSYVDPYLDYIRISLDNALWMGRYWLPYRQEAELRRELPALDFLAGSIIRGRFEIGGYEFNQEQPLVLFARGLSAVSVERRQSFPFERGLFDDLEEAGLAPTPNLEDIRDQALQMAGNRYLTGLSPWRLHLASVSDGVRRNRAEGLFVGAGTHIRTGRDVLIRASAGYAFGANEPHLALSTTSERGHIAPTFDAYWHDLRDIGTLPGAAPVIGTLSSSFGADDYLDPYFARGVRLRLASRSQKDGAQLTMRFEQHSTATDVISDLPGTDRRAVRPVPEGILGAIAVRVPLPAPWGGTGSVEGSVARFEARSYQSAVAALQWSRDPEDAGLSLSLEATAGVTSAAAPPQALFLLGGRGTMPGYGFREFVGTSFGLLRAEASHPLLHPWVGIRTFAAVGITHLPTASAPAGWRAYDSDGLRPSVGIGLSFGWDVLRLDLGRGLRDGNWELIFSVDPRFRSWL
jgi:hypothetical protein